MMIKDADVPAVATDMSDPDTDDCAAHAAPARTVSTLFMLEVHVRAIVDQVSSRTLGTSSTCGERGACQSSWMRPAAV
jgi:hypothetical protein